MDIHEDDVNYFEFKILEFHNFMKNDQIAAKLLGSFPMRLTKK